MCGSMADIQSVAAEIRLEKKEEEERKNKPQHENIYGLPIPQGDHKQVNVGLTTVANVTACPLVSWRMDFCVSNSSGYVQTVFMPLQPVGTGR